MTVRPGFLKFLVILSIIESVLIVLAFLSNVAALNGHPL